MEVTFTNLKGPATMPTLVQNYFTYYDVPISSVLLTLPWQMNRIFTIIYYLFLQFNLFFANWIFVLKKAVYHYGKRPVNMY